MVTLSPPKILKKFHVKLITCYVAAWITSHTRGSTEWGHRVNTGTAAAPRQCQLLYIGNTFLLLLTYVPVNKC